MYLGTLLLIHPTLGRTHSPNLNKTGTPEKTYIESKRTFTVPNSTTAPSTTLFSFHIPLPHSTDIHTSKKHVLVIRRQHSPLMTKNQRLNDLHLRQIHAIFSKISKPTSRRNRKIWSSVEVKMVSDEKTHFWKYFSPTLNTDGFLALQSHFATYAHVPLTQEIKNDLLFSSKTSCRLHLLHKSERLQYLFSMATTCLLGKILLLSSVWKSNVQPISESPTHSWKFEHISKNVRKIMGKKFPDRKCIQGLTTKGF